MYRQTDVKQTAWEKLLAGKSRTLDVTNLGCTDYTQRSAYASYLYVYCEGILVRIRIGFLRANAVFATLFADAYLQNVNSEIRSTSAGFNLVFWDIALLDFEVDTRQVTTRHCLWSAVVVFNENLSGFEFRRCLTDEPALSSASSVPLGSAGKGERD